MSKFLRLSAAIAVLAATPVFAEDPSASTVIATVNGEEITLGQMIMVREGLPDQYRSLPDDVLFDGILDQLVQQLVLAQSVTGPLSKRVEIAIANERLALIASQAAEGILLEDIPEDDVLAIYEEQFAKGEPELEYNASHILLESQADAAAVVAELDGGADFAALAKEKSTGPSGPSGGQLGWFGKGRMVPAFEEAVIALDVGAVSNPIQTQFGWHVILLHETRQLDAPPLEAVRDQIETELRRAVLEDRISQMTGEATVDRSGREGIEASQISNTALLEDD